ncbi:hypothetical protein [Castellaniella sp.]|uniref:hypothetical protein n=1 Tax=Castellaniella sp. TaxID=1955812 RepID=UPI0035676D48
MIADFANRNRAWAGGPDSATRPDPGVPVLQHPGPPDAVRRNVLAGHGQKVWRIPLVAGQTLQTSVLAAMRQLKVSTAGLGLQQAVFSHLRYFEIATSPDVVPVAHYTTPRDRTGPLELICAGATVGQTAAGQPAIHCHALTVDRAGHFVGGHLLPQACMLAQTGVAWLWALDHMRLVIGDDPEICTPVFHPILSEDNLHGDH